MTWCTMCGQFSHKLHKSVQITKPLIWKMGAKINYPCIPADVALRLAQQLYRIITLPVNSYGDSPKEEKCYIN